jgi:hypothetical protein
MDGAALARIRWRRRGAWMWPAFVALTVADGLIGHTLPPVGESQSFMGALLVGCFLNLIGVVLLTRPLSIAIRRSHPELPVVVARDYAGRAIVLMVTVALVAAGLAHRHTIQQHQRAMRDAVARAEAWIGDRAPAEFRRSLHYVNVYAIEPGHVYRMCVPSATRTYCVVVKTDLPFQRSVSFAGYEPNSVFAPGAE